MLVYDGNKMADGPKSWADFWDVEKFPGKRGMLGQALYTLENALMADGVPRPMSTTVLRTPEGVDRAFAKLDQIKPHVVWWTSSSTAMQNLDAGEVVMTDMYNGRVTYENENNGKTYGSPGRPGSSTAPTCGRWWPMRRMPRPGGRSWSSSPCRKTRPASRGSTPMAPATSGSMTC